MSCYAFHESGACRSTARRLPRRAFSAALDSASASTLTSSSALLSAWTLASAPVSFVGHATVFARLRQDVGEDFDRVRGAPLPVCGSVQRDVRRDVRWCDGTMVPTPGPCSALRAPCGCRLLATHFVRNAQEQKQAALHILLSLVEQPRHLHRHVAEDWRRSEELTERNI